MKRLILLFSCFAILLPLFSVENQSVAQTTPRLVVFESFMRSTCGNCQAAVPAIEQLAAEYAAQPVLLLEQDVDQPAGIRSGRWWTAFDGSAAVLPMTMVGSGYQISNGYVNFYATFKNMIEAEKARPPKADVTAFYQRVGNHFEVMVAVTNKSGVPLSYDNQATVHVIVYEEAKVKLTKRFVRAASSTMMNEPLQPAKTAVFDLTTAEIAPVSWEKVHVIALVDYLPDPSGPYDTLQAAVATEGVLFEVRPDTVVYMVSPAETAVSPTPLTIIGPAGLTWQTAGAADWFAVSPLQGDSSAAPQISLHVGNLADGWQEKTITFTANVDGATLQDELKVRAYRGPLHKVYLPTVNALP